MGKGRKSGVSKKAVTIRLEPDDHTRLLEMTESTGISINSFVRKTIQALHELARDELPKPKLPLFFAVIRTSVVHDSKDIRFK
ncbi:MAG: hypothetical protein CMI31_05090 [Opitutae bacterium]|nr:hypothetical protein [Opitutae bacterium]|tara:strand:- start:342 stop:590 length:249 start_codon:yes stop_codon:yes gene_type:complete